MLQVLFLLCCLALPACGGLSPSAVTDLARGATDAAVATDTNRDGRISTREAHDASSNYGIWLGIIGTVLGLLGSGGAVAAGKSAARANAAADELFDATHEPIAKSQP